jgi:hypothetical protein
MMSNDRVLGSRDIRYRITFPLRAAVTVVAAGSADPVRDRNGVDRTSRTLTH